MRHVEECDRHDDVHGASVDAVLLVFGLLKVDLPAAVDVHAARAPADRLAVESERARLSAGNAVVASM